jgi:hypothetical protein
VALNGSEQRRIFIGLVDCSNTKCDWLSVEADGVFVRFAALGEEAATVKESVAFALVAEGLEPLDFDELEVWNNESDEFRDLVASLSDDAPVVLGDTFSYEIDDE